MLGLPIQYVQLMKWAGAITMMSCFNLSMNNLVNYYVRKCYHESLASKEVHFI